MGSLCELETQLIIANNLKYVKGEQLKVLTTEVNEIQKMIRVFSQNLMSKD